MGRVDVGVDVVPAGAGEGADLRLGIVGGVHGVVVLGPDHPGSAGAGVEFDHLVGAARTGADGDHALAVRRERRCDLGPRPGRVDDLAGVRVEDPEDRRATAVHDGDESVRQGGEPAQAELPQRPAELLLARAQGCPVAVEVPPAAAVADVQQAAVVRPVDLGDRLPRAPGDGPRAVEGAVGPDVGDQQLRAVPRHARMVPREPCRAPPVGRDPRAGDEPVPVVGEFPHGTAVVGRRAVQGYGGQDAPHVGGPLPRELLQYAPHFTVVEPHQRLHPAQSTAHRGHGGERTRVAALLVPVEPLVGEVDEDDERPALDHHARPGLSAVLDDPAAHVPRSGQDRLLTAVGPAPYQGPPAALRGARLGPPRLVPHETHVLGTSVVRGGQGRVDGRGPGTVGQCPHCLPHSA